MDGHIQSIIPRILVSEILPYLTFIDDTDKIRAAEKNNPREAVRLLMEEINMSDNGDKWNQLNIALDECGYDYILQCINGCRVMSCQRQKDYINMITPVLIKMINVSELLPSLCAKAVLSNADVEEIKQEQTNKGDITTAVLLLNRIQRKHSHWYIKFIESLKEAHREDIANKLEIPGIADIRTQLEINDFSENEESFIRAIIDVENEEFYTNYVAEGALTAMDYAFRPSILSRVIASQVLPHLPFIEDKDKIRAVEKYNPRKAVSILLEEIEELQDIDKWKQFMEALNTCGYHYIVSKLKGHRVLSCKNQKEILRELTPVLSKLIDAHELLPLLHAKDIINDIDKEEIEREYANNGRQSSAILMLDRITRKHSLWFTKFIEVLRELNMGDIEQELEKACEEKHYDYATVTHYEEENTHTYCNETNEGNSSVLEDMSYYINWCVSTPSNEEVGVCDPARLPPLMSANGTELPDMRPMTSGEDDCSSSCCSDDNFELVTAPFVKRRAPLNKQESPYYNNTMFDNPDLHPRPCLPTHEYDNITP